MQSFSVRPRLVLLFDSSTAERYRSLPADLHRRAFEKLAILNAAITIDNLEVPPGNRLETLRGNRTGQHSIRVNDQYRVCFVWRDGNAFDVEVVDYH